MNKIRLAIIGATGLVGTTFIKLLEENNEFSFDIKLFASKKSEGKRFKLFNKHLYVHELNEDSFIDIDYACFFVNNELASKYIPIAISKNVKVIDNSSFYRLNDDVKLIVPSINGKSVDKNDKLIANPNCSTIQSVIPLSLLKKFGISQIIYNTYQSVSGSGKKGIDDLLRCRKGKKPIVYNEDISFTCIPCIGNILIDGYSDEEHKMINETKKILDLDVDVYASCVRVPIMFTHGVSIQVKLTKKFSLEEIISIMEQDENIIVCKDKLPTSTIACYSDYVYVGRFRKDNDYLLFYCVADNIKVGAASNAYNILKLLLKTGDENK